MSTGSSGATTGRAVSTISSLDAALIAIVRILLGISANGSHLSMNVSGLLARVIVIDCTFTGTIVSAWQHAILLKPATTNGIAPMKIEYFIL